MVRKKGRESIALHITTLDCKRKRKRIRGMRRAALSALLTVRGRCGAPHGGLNQRPPYTTVACPGRGVSYQGRSCKFKLTTLSPGHTLNLAPLAPRRRSGRLARLPPHAPDSGRRDCACGACLHCSALFLRLHSLCHRVVACPFLSRFRCLWSIIASSGSECSGSGSRWRFSDSDGVIARLLLALIAVVKVRIRFVDLLRVVSKVLWLWSIGVSSGLEYCFC